MRILKIISCALLCAFIIICSCLPIFAAETAEPTKPKNYSQMTEAELLANNQIPIDYIIKTIQKQIDKTVKDDNDKEIRLYDFIQYLKQEDGTYKESEIPVGKFNLANFLQDKYFIFSYSSSPVDSAVEFSPMDKEKVYIDTIYVFDSLPFVGVKQTEREIGHGDISEKPGFIHKKFELVGKPGQHMGYDVFSTLEPQNDIKRSFYTRDGQSLIFNSETGQTGNFFKMGNYNAFYRSAHWDYNVRASFYMNFMPEGGDGMLNPYVVTDKDISSEKQYIDDPDRPDGNYKYGIYEFQDGVMTMAQYFEEQPEVIPSKVGSMTNYTTKHKGKSYVWDVAKNTFTDFSADGWNTRTTELFKDYPSTNTVTKFSWTPFDGYEGETYEDNALLVDGNGYSSKRPIGTYPFVLKQYLNSQLYKTIYFQVKPGVSISNVSKNYEKGILTATISVMSDMHLDIHLGTSPPWYVKKQDVFWSPKTSMIGQSAVFQEDFSVNMQVLSTNQRKGNYVTFNWDAGAATDELTWWNPFNQGNGNELDPFYEENKDIITDDEGNPIGQGDGSKPGKDKDSDFTFGEFEFNADSLWKYATEFLNFCKNAFAVLPSFIWTIFATSVVVVVVMRILGR